MEEKNVTKISLSTFFLILAIITIVIMGIFLYKLNYEKTTEIQKSAELQAQVNNLNGTVSDLQEKINTISETIENKSPTSKTPETSKTSKNEINQEENVTTKNTSSKQKWNGDITSIDMSGLKKDDVQYEELTSLVNSPKYVKFKNVNGNISISLDVAKVNWLAQQNELENLGYTGKDYDGFSNFVELKNVSNIKFVECGAFGQDFWKESKVLFLTNDGIVKYESFENVVKNRISLKTVDKLKNIVQLYACSIVDIVDGERMGGAMTTIAVDENGIAYDLNAYMN